MSNKFWEIVEASPLVNKAHQIPAIAESILGDYYIQEYYKILEFGVITFLLSFVLGLIAYIFSLNSIKDTEKLSEYECGFEPFDSATRLPFDVHFYIVGILFLIFDVEIAVLFPWVLGLKFIGWYGFYTMILFLIILTVGFIYEWQRGALKWTAVNPSPLTFMLRTSFFVTDAFFETINEHATYSTLYSEIMLMGGEVFLSTAICLLFIFVSYTAKVLDNNSKRVFAVSINNLSILILIITFIIIFGNLFTFSAATPIFSMSLINDYYGIIFKLSIIFSVILILLSSPFYLISRRNSTPEFPLLILLATLFLLLLVSAFNLFTAFMCIIGFSLALYVLILADVEEFLKREASIKYYYLSVYSSGFLIFGIFLLYLITNSLNYVNIKVFIHNLNLALDLSVIHSMHSQSILLLLAIALFSLLIGILFKLSAVPCHFWAPEVYDGSPNVVTAYFILPVKIAVFAFFIRLFSYVFLEISFLWQNPLLFVAFFSMLWGCFCAVNELKIKRFIAYTSINQIGFLLIGITANSLAGYQASIIYLLIYVIMNIAFLTLFLNTYNLTTFTELKYFGDFKYIKFQQPFPMFYLAVIVFSMAGIPPFAGFFGKYFLLIEAFDAALYSLVFVALFTSLISAYYYIRIIKISFFDTTVIDQESIQYSEYIYDSFSLLNLPLTFTQVPLISKDLPVKNFYLQLKLPFFACLLFVPSSIIPWFYFARLFNRILYKFFVLLLVIFLLFINYIYKISFLVMIKTIFVLSDNTLEFLVFCF